MTIRDKDLIFNYKRNALKLLVKYDSPTTEDVIDRLCENGNCPSTEVCLRDSFKSKCGHIFSVKQMIDDILETINRY